MHFITIGQYFNRLQSVLFFILLIPLLVFIALLFFEGKSPTDPIIEEHLIILPAIVFLDWLMAIAFVNKKIKSIRKEQGLGAKLDQYFSLSILRFSLLSAGSIILALGIYFTRHDLFVWIFIGGMILSGILWPTSKKVSKDLRLKGAERQMVYFKRDTV